MLRHFATFPPHTLMTDINFMKSPSESSLACDYCRVKKLKLTSSYSHLTRVERRLARVEHLFGQLLPDVNIDEALASRAADVLTDAFQPTASQSPANAASPSSPTQPGSAISETVPEEADGFDWQEDVDELADGMASLSVEPTGAGYLGSTAGVFFLRSLLFWAGRSTSLIGDHPKVERPYPEIESSSQLSHSVASRQVIERLVNSYFSVYHRSYPFVHEPSFRAQLHEVVQRPQRRSWQMLLHTIVALGGWCLNHTHSELDDQLYHHALSFGEDECLFESANLTFVQALILFSNLCQKRNKPNTGSNFLGLATRMALSLGLHRELPDWNIGPLQREMRRRVWWGLYMFDSGASTTFGRPILLPETEAMDVWPVLNIHDEYLTSRTELSPKEIDEPTLYSGMKYQSDLHLKSNHISNRLLSSSGISPEGALSMDATLDRWSNTLPMYLRLDYDVSLAEPSFYFNRSRLWWRFWNLKIITFRQLFLKRAVERGKGIVPTQVNQVDEKCRSIAVHAASATVASIDQYTKHREITRLVAWYSIYFIFHASLVISLAILGDSESPELPKWQGELNTVRHIFRNVFVDNQLAARCANILDVIVPDYLATPEDWTNFQLDPSLMDFSTWPTVPTDDFFGIFSWPEFSNNPE
ncbi:fungal-specific transcription factor domain-containing protein [Thelonectria olida]|uniref:Fungal-specific transcription factor domain-containing protein n=1 Tax=Thelonectria olida TaxID=1576542 RepID=A0A9P8VQN1_9HYPO|nr:fungal-specific transcription factor domain-containing protein [Thelonectria olida]